MQHIRCSASSSAKSMTRKLNVSFGSAVRDTRVAAFLVEIEGRLGRRDSLELSMTRRDIGDYLGLSIETVSRSISQLQRRHALNRVEPRLMHLNQTKIDAMVEH